MKGILIKSNNSISVLDMVPPYDESIRTSIDGYMEIVHPRGLERPYCMVVDEEGLIKDKEINLVGCVLYETYKHGSPISGDILILREFFNDFGWDLEGLNDNDINLLLPQFKNIVKSYKQYLREQRK